MAQDNSIPLRAFQQSSPVDNFLSTYSKTQELAQNDEMHKRKMGALDQADEERKRQLVADALIAVPDGDAAAFEQVKQGLVSQGVIDPQTAAQYDVSRLGQIKLMSQKWRDMKTFEADQQAAGQRGRLTEAQIAAQQANTAQSYAQINALKNKPPAGFDPVTGRREAPAGVQGKDYTEVSKFSTEADAAAKIATTLQGVLPAIEKGWSGPDFGTRRSVAGALWAMPGDFGPGREIINSYDQIDQASKISGIEALKGIGGSDTERELLTAIQTGVNPELTPKENARRARGQIAAAEIVSKKAQLASEWVNRFGSLQYAAPDGTTWQKYWPATQKEAWAKHRQREAAIVAEERRKMGGGQANSVVDAADAIISKPRGRNDGR